MANQPKNRTDAETPKVLLYDLETSPNLSLTWGTREQDVTRVLAHRRIISFAWKWLGDKKANVLALPDFPGYRPGLEHFMRNSLNNRPLVVALHNLFCQADVTVGQNIIDFDDKRSNTDFIKHGLKPPPPHKQFDTLQLARSKFGFNSNRLDDLGEFLGVGRKVKHPGFDMWMGCLEGKPQAWAMMKKYNLGDVDPLLEGVYLKLRPWSVRHPSLIPTDRAIFECPYCRGKIEGRGFRYTRTGKVQRFYCVEKACGKWSIGAFVKNELRIR